MATDSKQEINLRPIYKKIDSALQGQIIYPAKYKGARKPGIMKRLLKKNGDFSRYDRKKQFNEKLQNISPEMESLFAELEGAGLSKARASQIIYERISHNASKHLKLSKEEIESAVKLSNGIKLQSNNHNLLIPPYLIDQQDLEKIKDKTILSDIGASTKSIAEENARKPYSLGDSVKAYDSYISMVKKGYIDEPNIQEINKSARITRKKYYKELLSRNQNRKKFPKKSLTEFEKRGLEVFNKVYTLNSNIIRAERTLDAAERVGDLSQINKAKEQLEITRSRMGRLRSEETTLLEAFVTYTSDNKKFNKRMGRILRSEKYLENNFSIHSQQSLYNSSSLIYKHSHKTRGLGKLDSIKSKLGKIVSRMDKNEAILESEKISLSELGIVERFNRNQMIFGLLEKISPNSEEVKNMIEQSKELRPMERSFYNHISQDGSKTFKTGDIILDSSKLRREVDGKRAGLSDKLFDKFIKYDHAALALEHDGKTYKSHVTTEDIELSLEYGEELIISEHYRIHPEALIKDKKMREDLKLVLAQEGADSIDPNGPKLSEGELAEKLSNLFQHHSSFIHKEIQEGEKVDFENPSSRQMSAGMANLRPGGHKKGHSNISWIEKVTGRSKEAGMDLRQALLEDTGGKMICSEYAARVTLLSMVKLDEVLKEKMVEKGMEVKGKGIMSMPLVKEKLSKVHPERLLKALPKGAVEKVESALAKSAVKRS